MEDSSNQTKAKTINLETQSSEGSRGFLGYCRELSSNLSGDEKGWANVYNPKNLCFLRCLCVSRFMFLTLGIVASREGSGAFVTIFT